MPSCFDIRIQSNPFQRPNFILWAPVCAEHECCFQIIQSARAQFAHVAFYPRSQPTSGPIWFCKHLVENKALRNKARHSTGFYCGPTVESPLSVFICALACSLCRSLVLGEAADTLQAPCPLPCESRDAVWHQTWGSEPRRHQGQKGRGLTTPGR